LLPEAAAALPPAGEGTSIWRNPDGCHHNLAEQPDVPVCIEAATTPDGQPICTET